MQELNQYFLCFHGNVRTFERMSNSNILLELYSTLTVKCFWRFLSSKKCLNLAKQDLVEFRGEKVFYHFLFVTHWNRIKYIFGIISD